MINMNLLPSLPSARTTPEITPDQNSRGVKRAYQNDDVPGRPNILTRQSETGESPLKKKLRLDPEIIKTNKAIRADYWQAKDTALENSQFADPGDSGCMQISMEFSATCYDLGERALKAGNKALYEDIAANGKAVWQRLRDSTTDDTGFMEKPPTATIRTPALAKPAPETGLGTKALDVMAIVSKQRPVTGSTAVQTRPISVAGTSQKIPARLSYVPAVRATPNNMMAMLEKKHPFSLSSLISYCDKPISSSDFISSTDSLQSFMASLPKLIAAFSGNGHLSHLGNDALLVLQTALIFLNRKAHGENLQLKILISDGLMKLIANDPLFRLKAISALLGMAQDKRSSLNIVHKIKARWPEEWRVVARRTEKSIRAAEMQNRSTTSSTPKRKWLQSLPSIRKPASASTAQAATLTLTATSRETGKRQ